MKRSALSKPPLKPVSSAEKRQHKIEQRRQQIFSAALSCFERRGYHETSVNDISSTAGVSSGLVYQYFNDKQDLLFQVIIEILEAYNRDIPNALIGVTDPLLRLQTASIAYYKVIDRRIPATLFAYRESGSVSPDQLNALKAKEIQTNNLIKDCIVECMEAGYCIDFDPELATYWIITTAHAWSLKNWRLSKTIAFEQYVIQTLGVFLNGMLNDEGHRHLAANNLLDGRPL